MTVKELIEALQEYDKNLDIKYFSEGIFLDCCYPREYKEDDKKVIVIGL